MPDFARATVPAKVRNGELRTAEVRLFERGQIVCLALSLGPPRLWGYNLDAVFDGLASELHTGLDEANGVSLEPALARVELSSKLHRAMDAAASCLRARLDSLLERERGDVGLLLLGLTPGQVHVLSCGPMRAYLRRTVQVKRVNTREDRGEGLLRLKPASYTERVEPGDLLLAGPQSAFSDEASERLARALAEHPELSTEHVVTILNKPAVESGTGSGSFALRFPQF